MISFSKVKKEKALQMSAQRLLQDLRRIQEKALSPTGQRTELCDSPNPPQDEIEGLIVGAYFNQNNPESYILFVDCDSEGAPGRYRYNEDRDKELVPIGFEKNVKIKNLFPTDSNSDLDIVFVPPAPDLYINGDLAENGVEIQICLKNNCSSSFETIRINKSGLVELE